MRLEEVLPQDPATNLRNRIGTYTHEPTEMRVGNRFGLRPDSDDIGFSQFRAPMVYSSMRDVQTTFERLFHVVAVGPQVQMLGVETGFGVTVMEHMKAVAWSPIEIVKQLMQRVAAVISVLTYRVFVSSSTDKEPAPGRFIDLTAKQDPVYVAVVAIVIACVRVLRTPCNTAVVLFTQLALHCWTVTPIVITYTQLSLVFPAIRQFCRRASMVLVTPNMSAAPISVLLLLRAAIDRTFIHTTILMEG